MNTVAAALAIAVTVEAIMEYLKSGFAALREKSYGTIAYHFFALLLCLLICFSSNVDLFRPLGIAITPEWLGIALTAVLTSRGAGYLRSVITLLQT